jgi:hypothetical protein
MDWSLRQIAVIALGLLFALSASTLSVQASSMGAPGERMMSASTMDVAHQILSDCADGTSMPLPCKDIAPACYAICGASVLAVLVEPQPAAALLSTDEPYPSRVESLLGSSTPPNPPPPRAPYIG